MIQFNGMFAINVSLGFAIFAYMNIKENIAEVD